MSTPSASRHHRRRGHAARMLDDGPLIRQWPSILSYPVRGHALGVVIVFSLMLAPLFPPSGLLSLVFGGAGIIILLSWTFKYAFWVLEHSAWGYAQPPPFSSELLNPLSTKPFQLLLYVALWVSIAGLFRGLGTWAVLGAAGVGLLLLPAAAINIALGGGIATLFYPLALVSLIKRLGPGYLLISLGAGLPLLWMLFFAYQLPRLVLMPVFIYVLLLAFHLSGVILYRRREETGLAVALSPEREEQAEQHDHAKELGRILGRIHVPNQVRDHAMAEREYREGLRELGDTLAVHEELFARLSLWERKYIPRLQARRYITLLLQQGKPHQALAVYRVCSKPKTPEWIANFAPALGGEVLKLAEQAYREQDYPLALGLLEEFQQKHPQHPEQIASRILQARILIESGAPLPAREVLAELLKHAQHPRYAEIQQLASRVSRTGPRAGSGLLQ